jgi:hypothetical protein
MRKRSWVWVLAVTAWCALATGHGGQAEPVAKGQRVFTCGHSFHWWVAPILAELAQAAGIQDHHVVGTSMIGGSRVIQHWNVPEEKNKAKQALAAGQVDVLTLSPMHQPDDGIERFARLALEHNPNVRVTVLEFWLPFDSMEWPFKGKNEPATVDARTAEELRKLHEPYFKAMDDHVVALNKSLGKQAVYVVPMGQAVLALREKIIAGQAPGIAKQSELFTDKLGHPGPALEMLEGYCQFAVVYRRTPVGLPMPPRLARKYKEDLNRLLQEIAWDAVVRHPLSGVTAGAAAAAAPGAEGDFVPLLNGKDLSGWATTGNWIVEEGGAVALRPRPGESGWTRYSAYLTTERKYKDFVLDLEFKINKGGNSGVFLRVGNPKDHVGSGFEIQILDTHGLKNPGNHDCGGVIGAAAPSKNMAKPAGEWNRYVITLQGTHLKVEFNGEQTIDLDLAKSPLKNRPAEGYIGFQDEGLPVWYRNVRIKELR